eukprot:6561481-Lingulodinium_polyedra.AAC.1
MWTNLGKKEIEAKVIGVVGRPKFVGDVQGGHYSKTIREMKHNNKELDEGAEVVVVVDRPSHMGDFQG